MNLNLAFCIINRVFNFIFWGHINDYTMRISFIRKKENKTLLG